MLLLLCLFLLLATFRLALASLFWSVNRSKHPPPTCPPPQYYSLKQLVTLLEHAEAPMVTYIAACTSKGVKWVASIEKADVLAYLRGQTDDAAQVRYILAFARFSSVNVKCFSFFFLT